MDEIDRRREPDRGILILLLGICGFLVCFFCGMAAWSMGNTDLAKMRAGRMRRDGEGLTRTGRLLGMISTTLVCAFIAVTAVVGIVTVVTRDSGGPTERSDVIEGRAALAELAEAIERYRATRDALPRSLSELRRVDPDTGRPYLYPIPDDPWGTPYRYRLLPDGGYRIRSFGDDGFEGGGDDLSWPEEDR